MMGLARTTDEAGYLSRWSPTTVRRSSPPAS